MKFISIVTFVLLFIISSLMIFVSIQKDTIKVGLLYSKSGTMATEEHNIREIVHFAIEQINQQGGILSQRVEIIEYDGKSNPKNFEKGAQFLIDQEVKTIFGCWTSASRKAIKPLIEKNNALLFYPVQYEGFEKSPNIIYLGLSANQQINPTITFIKKNHGKRIFFVGSDYIYPRMTFLYLSELAKLIGIDIVNSYFVPLGNQEFDDIIQSIEKLQPDAIINTLNGDSNHAFFTSLQQKGIRAKEIPVFSTSIDETRFPSMDSDALQGHYITSSYFNTLQNSDNHTFKEKLQKRFGSQFTLTESGYNSYLGVQLWAKALRRAGSSEEINKIKTLLKGDSMKSITGIVYLDRDNNHLHKNISIGKINKESIDIVWSSNNLIKPTPFPSFKKEEFWIDYQKSLYQNWNRTWQCPTKEQIHE